MLFPDLGFADVKKRGESPRGEVEKGLFECRDNKGSKIVAFISKMFAVPKDRLPKPPASVNGSNRIANGLRNGAAEAVEESLQGLAVQSSSSPAPDHEFTPNPLLESLANDDEILLGFARLYSGTLSFPSSPTPSSLYILLPKYTPSLPSSHPKNKAFILGPIAITGLYEMMGRELVAVNDVRAGSLFAIRGLEGVVGRSGTLISLPNSGLDSLSESEFVNLAGVQNQVRLVICSYDIGCVCFPSRRCCLLKFP